MSVQNDLKDGFLATRSAVELNMKHTLMSRLHVPYEYVTLLQLQAEGPRTVLNNSSAACSAAPS